MTFDYMQFIALFIIVFFGGFIVGYSEAYKRITKRLQRYADKLKVENPIILMDK